MRRALFACAYWLTATSVFAANLPVVKPEQSGMSSERLKRLSAAMRGYMDRGEVAGTVMLVARRGRVVHLESQGLMDIDSKAPMRTDSIFRLASMTKPITSVAVMMLLEEGRFLLNDPVSKFIPEFKNPKVVVSNPPGTARTGTQLVPAEREITIRDLLTHTAGLVAESSSELRPEFEKFDKGAPPNENIADYTRRLAKPPLHFSRHGMGVWSCHERTRVFGGGCLR